MNIEQILLEDEGYRQFPYKCTAGKLTIGIGRNLEAKGLTRDEAEYLLLNDIAEVEDYLQTTYPVYNLLCDARQSVLINMTFNLGFSGVSKFKKMWAALANQDFKEASEQMLDSKWSAQVKGRANRLAKMMRSGCWD